jgi:mxaJ protein
MSGILVRRWACVCAAALLLPACAGGEGAAEEAVAARTLRVCADPNNLPFSNEAREGFENEIAELVARELDATVEYTWRAQRRGFIRETLNAGECDVLMGIPASYELALTTRPYYRSSYVFIYREDSGLDIRSFDDPALREVRLGLHYFGDDGASSPPVHALANRGITQNITPYSLYGDYREPNPPARLIEAVARGEVDVAIAWGPLAGYFAQRSPVELEVVPVSPQIEPPFLPMVFDISLGVAHGDVEGKEELEAVLDRNQAEIGAILRKYGVPVLGVGQQRPSDIDPGENDAE